MKRSMWFFGLLLAVAGLSSFRTADIAVSRPDRAQRRSLAKLERSYEYIRKMYVDSVDMAPLVEEAIRSMVQQLDPHTEYASAAEMAEFWSLYRGKFGGIGIQTQWIRDSLVVTSLLSGGAAEEAGIRPDDRIVRVDGRAVKEIPASELISAMRGDAGSKVKILVIRRGVCQPILYEIVRREIPLPSVELAYRVDSAVGYIKLIRFGQTTMREVQRAYEELDRPKELILDLRGNGGGLLDQAIALSGFFLPKGSWIVSTEGRSVPSVVHSARRNPVFPAEGRLIVLIDERSASASEEPPNFKTRITYLPVTKRPVPGGYGPLKFLNLLSVTQQPAPKPRKVVPVIIMVVVRMVTDSMLKIEPDNSKHDSYTGLTSVLSISSWRPRARERSLHSRCSRLRSRCASMDTLDIAHLCSFSSSSTASFARISAILACKA